MSTIEDYYCFEQLDAIRKQIFSRFSDRVFNPLVIPEFIEKRKKTWKKDNEARLFGWIDAHFQIDEKKLTHMDGLSIDSIIYNLSFGKKSYYIKSPLLDGVACADLLINHYVGQLLKEKTTLFVPDSLLVQLDHGTLMHCSEAIDGQRLSTKDENFPAEVFGPIGACLLELKQIPVTGFGLLKLTSLIRENCCVGLYDHWFDYITLNLEQHLICSQITGLISNTQKKSVQAFFKAIEPDFKNIPSVFLHGDFGIHNCLFKNNQLAAIIDWSEAMIGDPVFKIARFAMNQGGASTKLLLETYSLVDLFDQTQTFRFYVYQLCITISRMVHFAIREKDMRALQEFFVKIYDYLLKR